MAGQLRDHARRFGRHEAVCDGRRWRHHAHGLGTAIVGLGLWLGVFSGHAPVGVTLIPAAFGAGVIALVLSIGAIEPSVERALARRTDNSRGRLARWWHRAATASRAMRSGLTAAFVMVRRRDPALLGVLAAWGFDIAALWASFRAFGHSRPGGVLVMGYYVGTLANTLPLPGGIGGVEGGQTSTTKTTTR